MLYFHWYTVIVPHRDLSLQLIGDNRTERVELMEKFLAIQQCLNVKTYSHTRAPEGLASNMFSNCHSYLYYSIHSHLLLTDPRFCVDNEDKWIHQRLRQLTQLFISPQTHTHRVKFLSYLFKNKHFFCILITVLCFTQFYETVLVIQFQRFIHLFLFLRPVILIQLQ